MAGSFLLIHKKNHKEKFDEIIKTSEKVINKNFKNYFEDISYYVPNKKSYIINLQKGYEKKFHIDNKGNWITYEGVVFALRRTKKYNAAEMLNLYKDNPSKFPNHLDGHFVIKIFDKEKNEILIINDFIKNKTNYYTETEEFIVFSPLLLLCAIVKEPVLDEEAFNEYLWRYYILSDKTMFKGVKRLEPASIYKVKNNKISIEKYWKWPKTYTKLNFKKTVEKTVTSMKESARLIRKLGRPCLDFTMGQDTRQVVSSFSSQNIDFITSIFGKPDFYEVKNVKNICKKHNIKNFNITLGDNFTSDPYKYFLKSILLGSCEQPGYMLGRIMYMRQQQRKIGSPVCNGMDGHFYKNGLWDEIYTFNLYREPKKFNISKFLNMRAMSKNYNSDLFTDEFLKIKRDTKNYFTNLIKNSIKNYDSAPVSIQIDKFDLHHWLNFGTAANSACNLITESISPLLLRRNLEFALTVPVKWKFNLSNYQRALVYSMDNELAKEKTDFAGINMVPKNTITYIPFYLKYFYHQSSRLKNKIKTKLGLKVNTHIQEAWDYLTIYKKLLNDNVLQNLIQTNNMLMLEIIKEKQWNKYIENLVKNRNNLIKYELILKIISVELLLKKANNIFHKN